MIRLENINKKYKNEIILENLNFEFHEGKQYIILGKSGIGKTTLLRIIAGLESPDQGEVRIDNNICTGKGVFVHPSERSLGFVFQEPTLWPHMTVKKNILFGMKNKTEINKKEEMFSDIIKSLQIEDVLHKFPGQISHGQGKRVSIARTLILKPKYLLMDEPFTNLDNITKNIICLYIKDYVEKYKLTLIHVTHDIDELQGINAEILSVDNKKLIFHEQNIKKPQLTP